MSLDVDVMRFLDLKAAEDKKSWQEKDAEALDYINQIPLAKVRPGIRNQYIRYYYDCKRHLIENEEYRGYGHGV